mgnify:CR=1 FL=1
MIPKSIHSLGANIKKQPKFDWFQTGFFVGVSQLDLERGPGSALRADEALLADHVRERHATNRHAGLDVRVRGIYLLDLPLRLQGLEEIAQLIIKMAFVTCWEIVNKSQWTLFYE